MGEALRGIIGHLPEINDACAVKTAVSNTPEAGHGAEVSETRLAERQLLRQRARSGR